MPSNHVRLVFLRPDGGVSIDIPVTRIANDPQRLTKHVAKILENPESAGWTYQAEVHMENLPVGRKLRNAWRWDGAVSIDVPAGRAELLRQARELRDIKLKETDALAVRGVERGQPDAALTAYREALRDLPAGVELELADKETAAELEAYAVNWPQEPM